MLVSKTYSTERLEVLSRAECEELLHRASLGRLALVVDGQPEVFPVNFAFGEGSVVFRTAPGLKLESAPLGRVAFEVDEVDVNQGIAWSVVVKGEARDISTTLDDVSARLRNLIVRPKAPGAHEALMAIFPASISGRRFGFAPIGETPWLPSPVGPFLER